MEVVSQEARVEEDKINKQYMLVKARYKDAPEDSWFDVELTDDQRMIDVKSKREITRTDLLFKGDGDEIIDMEEEWADYHREQMLDDFHDQARYLAKQYFRQMFDD